MRHFGWLGAVLVLAACGQAEMARDSRQTAAIENDMFLAAALAHAQAELKLAQLAQLKAHTPALVSYARRIVGERAPLVEQLAAAAKTDGTSADGNHAPNVAAFQKLEGEAFERAFVAAQIEDQQNTIDIFDFASRNSADSNLKDLATGALPQLREDLTEAIGVVKTIPFQETSDNSQGVIVAPRRR